jgi:UDP-N-acetylmuramate dehydrogenase
MKKGGQDNPTLSTELVTTFKDNYFPNSNIGGYVFNRLGGIADHIVICENLQKLLSGIKLALSYKTPYLVIGSGSGLLISDVGFPGIVFLNRSNNIYYQHHLGQVLVDSGVNNDELLNNASIHGLGGMEFLTHIPGTVGGATLTNATHDRYCMGQYVKEVTVFIPDTEGGKTHSIGPDQLYTESSLFKHTLSTDFPSVVLSVRLQMAHLTSEEVTARLVYERRRRVWRSTDRLIGFVFSQELIPIIDTLPKLKKFRFKALRLNPKNRNIFFVNSKAKAQDIKNDLEAFKAELLQSGHQLDLRTCLIGYWPEGEENVA